MGPRASCSTVLDSMAKINLVWAVYKSFIVLYLAKVNDKI